MSYPMLSCEGEGALAEPKKASEFAFLVSEPQTLLRLIGHLREGEAALAEPKKASEFAFLVSEPQTLLRLIGNPA
jgi:hypothetical protein